jgi:hypothetical protein
MSRITRPHLIRCKFDILCGETKEDIYISDKTSC